MTESKAGEEKPENIDKSEKTDKPEKITAADVLKPVPVKMGRPSLYDPEICERVKAYGAEGKSKAVIAANLGISIRTLYNWMEQHKEFMQAMEEAETLAMCWWEEAGQKGMLMPGFNAAIWSRSMAARFPREWRENKNVEHTGKDGGPIAVETTTTISVDQMSVRALAALEEALDIIEQSADEDDDDDGQVQ